MQQSFYFDSRQLEAAHGDLHGHGVVAGQEDEALGRGGAGADELRFASSKGFSHRPKFFLFGQKILRNRAEQVRADFRAPESA